MQETDKTGVWVETQASPEFQELRRKFRGFAFPLTIAFLLWYASYVVLTAFARDFISIQVWGNVNLAFVLGVLQFVTTFLIMWGYERYSTKRLDHPSEELRKQVEDKLAAR